jgi:sterol desaturase/sphingolipid hydroxylase (fatty acid hydroxylase superfamily)
MTSQLTKAFGDAVQQIPGVGMQLSLCGLLFFALAVALKGFAGAMASGRAAAGETRINAILSLVDQVTVGPLLTVMAAAGGVAIQQMLPHSPLPPLWAWMGDVPTVLLTVFVGDFLGYWRHRIQHSRLLWPAHAVHHSDTAMTWFTLERMHPIDRIGSMVDTLILGALGFPAWALVANVMVRHFYGYVIHADAARVFGKLDYVFNTPGMHRWHHARDIEGSGSNFATVFSVFDRLFGTYYNPYLLTGPTGVREDMGRGVIGQYLYPLRVWTAEIRSGLRRRPAAPRALAPSAE